MADMDRTFTGSIKRGISVGKPIVWGSVSVQEGMIYSMAEFEDDLCRNLDQMCLLKLDHGLHHSDGVSLWVGGDCRFFLN